MQSLVLFCSDFDYHDPAVWWLASSLRNTILFGRSILKRTPLEPSLSFLGQLNCPWIQMWWKLQNQSCSILDIIIEKYPQSLQKIARLWRQWQSPALSSHCNWNPCFHESNLKHKRNRDRWVGQECQIINLQFKSWLILLDADCKPLRRPRRIINWTFLSPKSSKSTFWLPGLYQAIWTH